MGIERKKTSSNINYKMLIKFLSEQMGFKLLFERVNQVQRPQVCWEAIPQLRGCWVKGKISSSL